MKFISSNYDEETGISEVIMQHMGKKFKGIARCHPEEEYPSQYAGCALAERRAVIKALKYERNKLKAETDSIIKFLKHCECFKDFNKEEKSSKIMYKTLNRKIDKVNRLTDLIDTVSKTLTLDHIKRMAVLNKMKMNRAKMKKSN